jgi:hypothetical protein
MTTGQSESAVAEFEQRPQEVDEVAASIAAIEKAVFGAPAGHREAIRELGCSIVAQALKSPT